MYRAHFILVFIASLLISCQRQSPEAQLKQLGGYWEIQSVTLEDGTVKNFSINPNIDFIELNGINGVRKKLAPALDGTFSATNAAERFTAEMDGKTLKLHYATAFDQWTETVLKAQDSLLVVENTDGKTYSYKRYVPLKLHLQDE